MEEIEKLRITCNSGEQLKYSALEIASSWGPWRDLVTQASGELGVWDGRKGASWAWGASAPQTMMEIMNSKNPITKLNSNSNLILKNTTNLNANSLAHTRVQSVPGASSLSHKRHLTPTRCWVLRVSRENPGK